MKAFTIDTENNITAFASRTAAIESLSFAEPSEKGFLFASAEQLAEVIPSGKRLAAIWNGLTGVTQVKKFMSAAAGARRIFAELQKLEVPAAAPVPEAPAWKAPREKKAPAAGATAGTATHADGPRATSKMAQVIELAKRPGGVTLQEVMAFGWQIHTARSLMSAGGGITKKYGIPVISEKLEDGTRNYRIV